MLFELHKAFNIFRFSVIYNAFKSFPRFHSANFRRLTPNQTCACLRARSGGKFHKTCIDFFQFQITGTEIPRRNQREEALEKKISRSRELNK
jgi:hypothetical protein